METQARPDAVPVQELTNRLIHNMETVIMGKHDVIRKAVLCLLANGHILLEDLPGTGKTTLAKAMAQSLGLYLIHILRFFQGKTQMEVAAEIHISQAQVSRLEKGALEKIKREL